MNVEMVEMKVRGSWRWENDEGVDGGYGKMMNVLMVEMRGG